MIRSVISGILCVYLCGSALEQPLYCEQLLPLSWQQQNNGPGPDLSALRIVVIAGEDGLNIVKKKTAVQPVVEVRDKNDVPVAGVVVNFTTPNGAPSAFFANGGRTLSLVTDSTGRASVTGMQPVGTGRFEINVSASLQGRVMATASIAQTNFATPSAASSGAAASTGASAAGLSAGAITAIVAGVAAAAAVGAVLATHMGGGGASQPAATIGLASGTATVGAPH